MGAGESRGKRRESLHSLSPTCVTAILYGISFHMNSTQKITAHVPASLLRKAQAATGKGITETVRLGLDLLASERAAEDLRGMRGKVRLDIELAELRRDRR